MIQTVYGTGECSEAFNQIILTTNRQTTSFIRIILKESKKKVESCFQRIRDLHNELHAVELYNRLTVTIKQKM